MASHNIKPLVYKKALGGSRPKDGLMTGAQVDDLAAAKAKLGNLWTPDNASGTTSLSNAGGTIQNVNTVNKSGFYDAVPGTTGAPDAVNWWHIIHKEHIGLNGYRWQIATNITQVGGIGDDVIWSRRAHGGGWGPWFRVHSDSGWQYPVFAAGWGGWGGWPPKYRRIENTVIWSGMVTYVGGGSSHILTFSAAGFSPTDSVMFEGAASAGDGVMSVPGTGFTLSAALSMPPVSNWWSLNGLVWVLG